MIRAMVLLLGLEMCVLPMPYARAQIPVTDVGNLVAQAKNLLQELKSYATQIQQYTNEIQQLAWLETQVNGFIQNPTLARAEALMGATGITNPLGGLPSFYSVMALTSGFSTGQGLQGIMSRVAQLNAFVNSASANNAVYNCQDQTFACQQQQQLARANAGYQGVIGQIYSQLSDHLNITNALRSDLNDATDPAQREKIIAQLQAEQNWTQSATGQLQAATAIYQSQRLADANRDDQRLNADIDAILAAVPKGRGG